MVATDDTVLPMLSVGKTQPARMWVYVGDAAHPYNVFDFTLNRSRDGPQAVSERLHAGSAGRRLRRLQRRGGGQRASRARGAGRMRVGSSSRRRTAAPEIAREVVALLRALFAVEQQAKELSVAERFARRQAQSAPLLAELRQKLLRWKEQLLPKHPMAEAVNYTLGQWAELNVFCSDGAVPIDNNVQRTRDEARGAESQEFPIRRQPARRPHRRYPGQPDLHLPPARRRSATLPDAIAGEPAHLARCATSTPGCPTSGNSATPHVAPAWITPPPRLPRPCASRIAHVLCTRPPLQ